MSDTDTWNRISKHHGSLYRQEQSMAKTIVAGRETYFPNDSRVPEPQW